MKHCNVDAILQLVRPNEVQTSYFEVVADDQYAMLFIERLSSLGIKQEYVCHPLVQIEMKLFAEKVLRGVNFVRESLFMGTVMQQF